MGPWVGVLDVLGLGEPGVMVVLAVSGVSRVVGCGLAGWRAGLVHGQACVISY